MKIIRTIALITLKAATSILLMAIFAVAITGISPIYRFKAPEPFGGPDIFNPYRNLDTLAEWKRANFHTHTRVEGIFNECEFSPLETYEAYDKLGYDIVTFSNHNKLTVHPFDTSLQVNVYEHGYNLLKYHKLVFGCSKEHWFDHLLPVLPSQRQFQLDYLLKDSDLLQLNHQLRTNLTTRSMLEKLEGYQIMELDSGRSTENEYWDWALSAGHYSFALANDDLHYPDRSRNIAIRCNFLQCRSGKYEDIRKTLSEGCYYSMRVPDYGKGDWRVKYEKNRDLPSISDIGLKGDSIYIRLSDVADSIKVTGQNHTTLALETSADRLGFVMSTHTPYARFTAYFPEGEVIWSNPFARYDSTIAETPFPTTPGHTVNVTLTIIYNMLLLIISAAVIIFMIKLWKRR